jgi:type IV pilus assembly protein PilQ
VTSNGTRAGVSGVAAVGTDDAGRTLMQNLPMPTTPGVTSPTSGVGLIIGSLAGGTTIDMQITAAEQKGDLDIISEPSIVTSNGVAANIRSGETMYIKTTGDISIGQVGTSGTTAGGGTGLQTVETGIELKVTPQISVDNYIKLGIETQTSQLDFTRTVDGIPVVVDSNASTSVVVRDGETTVIGGLAKLTSSKTNRAVPGLSKIPLLGNLFKSRGRYKQNKDLMIFIRPVIVRSITDIPENAKYGKVVEMREQMMLAEDEKKPRKPAKNRSENRFKNRIK